MVDEEVGFTVTTSSSVKVEEPDVTEYVNVNEPTPEVTGLKVNPTEMFPVTAVPVQTPPEGDPFKFIAFEFEQVEISFPAFTDKFETVIVKLMEVFWQVFAAVPV
jgi:hypothetical protein